MVVKWRGQGREGVGFSTEEKNEVTEGEESIPLEEGLTKGFFYLPLVV